MNRGVRERIWIAVLMGCTGAGCGLLLWILAMVGVLGAPALSGSFLFSASTGDGAEGGIFFQMVGTILLVGGAGLICFPVALGAALFQTECLPPGKWRESFSLGLDALNAVPTVLFGLMGFLVFGVWLDTGVSWVTGVLILAIMILPTVQTSIRRALESVPGEHRQTAAALGLTPWRQVRAVALPHSGQGMVTGLLLGLARAAGETAAIMFTATVFSGVHWPQSFSDPVVTLQTHVLTLAQEAVNPRAIEHAWGAALVLLGLVMALLGGVLGIRLRLDREPRH
ncbi:MAG: PstA family ABC transporter permease [Nitrospinaceae bacterium]